MKKEMKVVKSRGKFAVTPFKALNGFHAENRAAEEKKPSTPSPQPAPEESDDLLFRRAVSDVKPLRKSDSSPEGKKKSPPPPRVDEEERLVFLREVEKMQLDVKFRDELPDDVVPLRKTGSSRLRELKRGAIRIGLELDLHGLTRPEALSSLESFIRGAYTRGQNAVLVITGKGNNSPDEPVLQMAVSGWLRDRGKGMVAEFAPAPRQLGGSGAFVVFLKDKPPVAEDME